MSEAVQLSGKKLREELLSDVQDTIRREGLQLKLCVVLVGDDSASLSYIKKKQQAAESVGMNFELIHLPTSTSDIELREVIDRLNSASEVTGYIIQLPLPSHLNPEAFMEHIDPKKDVDGFHPLNIGKLVLGNEEALYPATPQAIVALLKHNGISIARKHVVVVGRSNIVGKPLMHMLLKEDATVTLCHSKTENLSHYTKDADILICAIGKPGFFTKDMLKEGTVIVDVGCSFVEGLACGDVDPAALRTMSSAYAPVPGGVGPGTVTFLIKNVLKAHYLTVHVS